MKKYPCPCCGKRTLSEEPPGTYEICKICGWEDDRVQYEDPEYSGGANELCLNEARKRYKLRSVKRQGGLLLILFAIVLFALLFLNKIISFQSFFVPDDFVKGVDVSSYQGTIDWRILADQGIDFAFIKATEGSSFVDERFAANWQEAGETELKIGAYHFFSYDSSGKTQADNFIRAVGPLADGGLPPVIDIEFYGDKEKNPPEKEHTRQILDELLLALKEHYQMTPVIYATQKSYHLYIEDGYSENPVWIRNVYFKPKLGDGREWTFWQYSDREVLKGYDGTEKYIDMNVFRGDREEFLRFVSGNI